jgi:nucleotide-binding universal stress UspA family protein
MYRDILLPMDGSDEGRAALEHGFALAEAYEATVHALYVVDEANNTAIVGTNAGSPRPTLEADGDRILAEVSSYGRESGVEIRTAIRRGAPYREILAYADENDIDLLIMSSHGRSGLSRFVFGSVTERVTRSTNRPVFVVGRQKAAPG